MRSRRRSRLGFSFAELLLAGIVIMLGGLLAVYPSFAKKYCTRGSTAASNARQIALAGIMYGGDFDDRIMPTVNGWISRLQDRKDGELTVNCPASGTQRISAPDAGGAAPTRTWVHLVHPYIKSRGLFVDLSRRDKPGFFADEAKAASDANYSPFGATYRNQGRFPHFGVNYMFLAPLRVPKEKRGSVHEFNYATSDPRSFTDAEKPEATVFITVSRRSLDDPMRGFFAVNAPGMWNAFADNQEGYVAFWDGTKGSGDWAGTKTACKANDPQCKEPVDSSGFVYRAYVRNRSIWEGPDRIGGTEVTFLDGHVQHMTMDQLAAGADYSTAKAGNGGTLGSGARIVDKKAYLWNVDDNYYGL